MARSDNDIPFREHMRRRGVEPTVTDDEGTESVPDNEAEEGETDPRLGQKRKRGGRFIAGKGDWEKWTKYGLNKRMKSAGVKDEGDAISGPGAYAEEGGPVVEGPNEGEQPMGFEQMLLNNTDIPHELKVKILERYNMANPSDPNSIGNLHREIYGSGLPGELKDKLANLRTYGDDININKNRAKKGRINMDGAGPTSSVDPRTGQPWNKKIGPTDRQKLIDADLASKETPEPSPADVPDKQEGQSYTAQSGNTGPGKPAWGNTGPAKPGLFNPRPAPGGGNWWDILYGGGQGRPMPAPRPAPQPAPGGPPQMGPSQQPNPYQLLLMQMMQQGGR